MNRRAIGNNSYLALRFVLSGIYHIGTLINWKHVKIAFVTAVITWLFAGHHYKSQVAESLSLLKRANAVFEQADSLQNLREETDSMFRSYGRVIATLEDSIK